MIVIVIDVDCEKIKAELQWQYCLLQKCLRNTNYQHMQTGNLPVLEKEAWARCSLQARLAACEAATRSVQALAAAADREQTDTDSTKLHRESEEETNTGIPEQSASAVFEQALQPSLARLASGDELDNNVQDALLEIVSAAAETIPALLTADSPRGAAAAAAQAALHALAPENATALGAALAGGPARLQRWLAAACTLAVALLKAPSGLLPPRVAAGAGVNALRCTLAAIESPPRSLFADIGGVPAHPEDDAARTAARSWHRMAAHALECLPPLVAALDVAGALDTSAAMAPSAASPCENMHPRASARLRPGVLIEELPDDGDQPVTDAPPVADLVPALLAAALFIGGRRDSPWADGGGGVGSGGPPDAPWADEATMRAARVLVACLASSFRRARGAARRAADDMHSSLEPCDDAELEGGGSGEGGPRGGVPADGELRDSGELEGVGRGSSGSTAGAPVTPATEAEQDLVAALLPAAAGRVHRVLAPAPESARDSARLAPHTGMRHRLRVPGWMARPPVHLQSNVHMCACLSLCKEAQRPHPRYETAAVAGPGASERAQAAAAVVTARTLHPSLLTSRADPSVQLRQARTCTSARARRSRRPRSCGCWARGPCGARCRPRCRRCWPRRRTRCRPCSARRSGRCTTWPPVRA